MREVTVKGNKGREREGKKEKGKKKTFSYLGEDLNFS